MGFSNVLQGDMHCFRGTRQPVHDVRRLSSAGNGEHRA